MSRSGRLRVLRSRLWPAVALLATVLLAFVFRAPLINWFFGAPGRHTPADRGGRGGESAPAEPGPTLPALRPQQFSLAVYERLETALTVYEQMRASLAADSLQGIEAHARALAATLREAGEAAHGELAAVLRGAADTAARLSRADDLESARSIFGALSRHFVALAEADPRLTEGRFVFECPMSQGFNKWIQSSPELENPYMGRRMLACGSRSAWEVGAAQTHAEGSDEIAHYTCSMHPSVKQSEPGQCPICGMDLVPVTERELASGTVLVDEARRRRIGVKLGKVQRKHVVTPIRAVGEVQYDETKLHEVNLRMSGWVEHLVADETYARVRRGQVLFTLYSPELFAAQLEYLNALRMGRGAPDSHETLRATSRSLAESARQRLRLLGMPEGQIAELARRGKAWEHVPVVSPATGYILEKNVVEGAQIAAGTRVYRVADLDRVWIEAQVYETDLPYVKKGQQVEVTLPYVPGRTYSGKVDYVYPTLQERTRTGRVRVVLDNPELELRPEMYANLVFQADLGERLVVPESAVLYTGPRRIVFVDVGDNRLQPRVVELGARAGAFYEVREGLEAGEVVVTSGNFLIASESRLKSASGLWDGEGGHAGH